MKLILNPEAWRAAENMETGKKVPREARSTQCEHCPACSLKRRKDFLHSRCLFLWHSQHHFESHLCWWACKVLELLGSRKLSPPVRLPTVCILWAVMLGIVFPSTSEAGLPGFLPGHCTLWNVRIRVIYYQHLPLQAADQFPFLQMALTGQPKKALLAICFLLPFQAG